MLLIGLTGGIASGKTLVSDAFAQLGAPIVDADLIAREVVAPGSEGLAGLATLFGQRIVTTAGELDRAALRRIIFAQDDARAKVDALLHPLIGALTATRIEVLRSEQHAYAVHAIPLLLETQQVDRYDRIVVVDVPVQTQIERLIRRDDTSAADAQRIIDAQASRDDRLAVAHDVIDNTGDKAQTVAQVRKLHELYTQLAAA